MSRFWSCTIDGCSRAAAIDIGICRQCSKQFCSEHIASPEHTCKADIDDAAWEEALVKELQNLRQQINVTNLLRVASQANRDLPCSLDESQDLSTCQLGARVPRLNEASFSDDLTNRILLNECATLKWLERVDIPSPRLHGYALRGKAQNDIGVAFMLIDQMPGKPFDRQLATEEQLLQVYSQWSSFLRTLSQHTFDKIGSPMLNDSGAIEIGPITGDRAGTLDQLGPFDSGRDFYIGLATEYLRLIADKQVLGRFSVDAYLMMKYIRSLLEDSKLSPIIIAHDQGPFYLKHTDDKGDHLLIDEDWNICGMIDWSFARSVPAYEAFGPSLLTADMGDMYSGVVQRSKHDELLGQCLETAGGVLAEFARMDDRIRRFQFGIGIGSDVTLTEAFSLFKGILATVGEADSFPSWEQWRRDKIEEWIGEDATLKALIDQEKGGTTIPA